MNTHVPSTPYAGDPKNRKSTELNFLKGLITGIVFSSALFLSLVFLLILWMGQASVFGDEPIAINETNVYRPVGEMRRDVKAFLKNSKSEDDLDLQVGGIVDLCMIHQEIVRHPQFENNRTLKSIRAQAASRLKKYLANIDIEKLRHARREKRSNAETNRRLLAGEHVETPAVEEKDDLDELASRNRFVKSNNVEPGKEVSVDELLNDSMYSAANSLGNLTGGPAQMFGYLSANFAPPWDHGEELVDLIQNTINPEFWQRNGGAGIIHYYRPSRIIIVGATSKIHDDMTDMLRNLRRLSR